MAERNYEARLFGITTIGADIMGPDKCAAEKFTVTTIEFK